MTISSEPTRYIHQGKIVEKKPWSIVGFVRAILNLLALFIGTIFTTQPMNTHAQQYNHSKIQPTWGKGTTMRKTNIHSFGPAAQTGCAPGGG